MKPKDCRPKHRKRRKSIRHNSANRQSLSLAKPHQAKRGTDLPARLQNYFAQYHFRFEAIVEAHDERGKNAIGQIERFAFYEEAKKAYAIIATGESALYANIMLQKGVVTE